MGHLSPDRRWVHLYLNGLYWGIYTLTERPDEGFMASHLGEEKSEYDVLNANRLRNGSRDRFNHLRDLVKKSDVGGRKLYEEIERYLDIDGFIDYLLYNVYACNIDWPSRNFWANGSRSESPQFRFFNWDAETCFFQTWDHPRNPGNSDSLNYELLQTPRFREDPHGAGFFYRHLSPSLTVLRGI